MASSFHPAIAYLENHQYDIGATWCETAIAQEPDCISNYWYLGLFRLLQGDAAEAQAVWFTATTQLAPDALDTELQTLWQILRTEADNQLSNGCAYPSEQLYQQLLEFDQTQSSVYLQLGQAACLQGKLDEALDYWQTTIQLQPDCLEAYLQSAAVWQKLEQWEAAIAAYQQVIDLNPTVEHRYQLALCLAETQRWGAALEQLNQVLSLQPDFAAAYSDRGWMHLELNQWTPATQDFQAALQIHSKYAATYRNWVEHLEQAHLPLSDRLRQNATQLNHLCLAAEQVWQEWATQLPTAIASSPPVIEPVSPPDGYFVDTQTWAQTQSSTHYVAIDPESVIELTPPKTCDRALHFSFRLASQIPLPQTFVATIPKGRTWLSSDQSSSAIITVANELLGDLSPEFPLLTPGHPDKHPANHSIFNRQLPPFQTVNGTVAVIAGLTNDLYFHWMLDVLPRLDFLQRSGVSFESIDYFWVNTQFPFQHETLEHLGIPGSKILDPTQYPHVQADQLIVPSYPGSPAWMPKRVFDWLQDVFLEQQSDRPKQRDRIYITRQQASNRRIINESDVMAVLQAIGFRVVALESLTVQEQANLLASADVVISAHGGGLTNLAFCQPGTTVIEIFSPNFVYPCYWVMSNLLHLKYYYVTGTIQAGYFLHQHLYPNPRTEDIWVDLNSLHQTLQMANLI